MIISHKFRFIFIKTVKTAGTSIEVYLSDHCGPRDIVTPIFPPVRGHNPRNFMGRRSGTNRVTTAKPIFVNHMPARAVRRVINPKHWEQYFKFCVERNPWDRTLSHYHMVRRREDENLDFQTYLDSGDLCHNFFRYTDRAKNLIVDRVLRFEDLDDELSDVFNMLGIPFSGKLTITAKSEYRTDRRPYQEVYTPQQRDFVAKLYEDEIKMFNYTF